jgi:hypothetical protein
MMIKLINIFKFFLKRISTHLMTENKSAMMMTSSIRESFVNLRKHGMSPNYQYQQTPTANSAVQLADLRMEILKRGSLKAFDASGLRSALFLNDAYRA